MNSPARPTTRTNQPEAVKSGNESLEDLSRPKETTTGATEPAQADQSYNTALCCETLLAALEKGKFFRFHSSTTGRLGGLSGPILRGIKSWYSSLKVHVNDNNEAKQTRYKQERLAELISVVERVVDTSETDGARHPSTESMAKTIRRYAEDLATQGSIIQKLIAAEFKALADQLKDISRGDMRKRLLTEHRANLASSLAGLADCSEKIDAAVALNKGIFDNKTLAKAYMLKNALTFVKKAWNSGPPSGLLDALSTIDRINESRFFKVYEKPIADSRQSIHEYYKKHGNVSSDGIFGVGPVTSRELEAILTPTGWPLIIDEINRIKEETGI